MKSLLVILSALNAAVMLGACAVFALLLYYLVELNFSGDPWNWLRPILAEPLAVIVASGFGIQYGWRQFRLGNARVAIVAMGLPLVLAAALAAAHYQSVHARSRLPVAPSIELPNVK